MAKQKRASAPAQKPTSTKKATKPAKGRLKPRNRRYSNREHGHEMNRGDEGNHIINQGAPVKANIYRPSWTEGLLRCRAIPALKPQNPDVLDPIRFTTHPSDFSEWLIRVPAVSYTGDDVKMSFLLCDPAASDAEIAENPYVVCRKEIEKAIKARKTSTGRKIDPDWLDLVDKEKRDHTMKVPSTLGFFQALVYERGKKIYAPPERRPLGWENDEPVCVVQLTQSTWERLFQLLNEPNEKWDGPEDDWANAYKYGDILDPSCGKFITIWNPDVTTLKGGPVAERVADDDDEEAEDIANVEVRKKAGRKSSRSDDTFKGYDVRFEDNFRNPAAKKPFSAKIPDELPFNRYQWWLSDGNDQGLLYVPTELEIVQWMARMYRSQQKALIYGLDSRLDLLNDSSVQEILKARVSASVPGDEDEEDEDDKTKRRRARRDASVEDVADIEDELEEDEYDEEQEEGEEEEGEEEEGEEEEEEGEDEEGEEEEEEDEEGVEYEEDEEAEYSEDEEEEEEGEEEEEEGEEEEEEGDPEEVDDYYTDEEPAAEEEEEDEEEGEEDEMPEPDARERQLEKQLAEARKKGAKRTSTKKAPPPPPPASKKLPDKKKKKKTSTTTAVVTRPPAKKVKKPEAASQPAKKAPPKSEGTKKAPLKKPLGKKSSAKKR